MLIVCYYPLKSEVTLTSSLFPADSSLSYLEETKFKNYFEPLRLPRFNSKITGKQSSEDFKVGNSNRKKADLPSFVDPVHRF